jgi:tetratricopeptide (TPR) repeat protein
LEYLEKRLSIQREICDRSGEGATLNNISQIYDARGDYGKALEYLEKSLSIRREIGDRAGEGTTLNNISQIFKARGDYGKALEYLEKSLSIRREIGDRSGMIPTLHNIAHIHLQNRQIQEAIEKFGSALQIAIGTNRPYDIFDESRDLGNLLCRIGQKKQGLPLLQQALALGKQLGHPQTAQVEEMLKELSG